MNKEVYDALERLMHHLSYGGANDDEYFIQPDKYLPQYFLSSRA
jgi:hypothetical protein